METTRQFYETPLLWKQLETNLANTINSSPLMMCEAEVIVKKIYEQVQLAAQQEYQAALAQQQQVEQDSNKEKLEEEQE